MLRSSKNADQRKQWWYRVAGYSAVAPKFSSTGERAPGYRLSSNYFQKFKRMPGPDWAQKMFCIIVPNWQTVSPGFFS